MKSCMHTCRLGIGKVKRQENTRKEKKDSSCGDGGNGTANLWIR